MPPEQPSEPNICPLPVGKAVKPEDAAYCANANCVDRGSALYGVLCFPASSPSASAANDNKRPYTSPVDPRDLTAQALRACPETMALEERRTCIESAELRYLLAMDSNVAARCAAIQDRKEQLACANVVYLYGPTSPSRSRVDLWTKRDAHLAAKLPDWVNALTPLLPREGTAYQDPRCPAGEGLMPIPGTEGGFGAWGCKPLARAPIGGNRQASDPGAGVADPDTSMKEIAGLIADAIAPQAGTLLSEQDRETCKTAAYAAALGMMKGGTPPLPASCAAVIKAARTEFSYYASNYLFTDDRGLAELLAVLAIRYGPSGGSVFGAR